MSLVQSAFWGAKVQRKNVIRDVLPKNVAPKPDILQLLHISEHLCRMISQKKADCADEADLYPPQSRSVVAHASQRDN